jgi:hypothetical protein
MTETYRSILTELTKRRDTLMAELRGVTAAIAAIVPLANGESPAAHTPQQVESPALHPSASLAPRTGDYSRISVRWSALWHLAEFAQGPMRNAEVADAILEGGYHSGAGSFPNAVSAVLSVMRAKGELDGSPEVGYSLTDQGRNIWRSIKQSDRFRSVMSPSSSSAKEQPLLSVQ